MPSRYARRDFSTYMAINPEIARLAIAANHLTPDCLTPLNQSVSLLVLSRH
jgi:hypothetical protein